MNTDYIRAKVNQLRGSTPQERERILASIGVCAGLLPARQQSAHLSAQNQHEIQDWLKQNALRLKLPSVPNPPPPDERRQILKTPPHLNPAPETYYPPHSKVGELKFD